MPYDNFTWWYIPEASDVVRHAAPLRDSFLLSGLQVEVLFEAARESITELLFRARSRAIIGLSDVVDFIENVGMLQSGRQVSNWHEWKEIMRIWAGEVPKESVSDSFKKRCRRLFGDERGISFRDDNAWEHFRWHFPGLNCDPIKFLHGRALGEGAVPRARAARDLLLRAIERQEEEAAMLRTKHGFDDKTIAAAAAYLGNTRDLADKLRRALIRELESMDDACPYCEGSIGDQPHLDHIVPASHGGLSKRDNLVFVCATCNNKKSDFTLFEFANKQGLDFGALAVRLAKLGKRV